MSLIWDMVVILAEMVGSATSVVIVLIADWAFWKVPSKLLTFKLFVSPSPVLLPFLDFCLSGAVALSCLKMFFF